MHSQFVYTLFPHEKTVKFIPVTTSLCKLTVIITRPLLKSQSEYSVSNHPPPVGGARFSKEGGSAEPGDFLLRTRLSHSWILYQIQNELTRKKNGRYRSFLL
jgi:hypothetical protein